MSDPVTPTPAEVTPKAADPAALAPASTPAEPAAPKPAEAAPAPAAAPPKAEDPKTEVKKEEKAPDPKPPVAPDKYDLKLPEGSLLHASSVEKIASDAKALGLSQEQAQAMLNRESQLKADFQSSLIQQHNQEADAWAAAAMADSEIGGANHGRVVELSKRFIERFASPAFKELLVSSRYGDHPEMVRMVWRAAKLMSEDTMVIPGAQGSTAKKSAAEILYGGTTAAKE